MAPGRTAPPTASLNAVAPLLPCMLDSLPPQPLTEQQLFSLNDADALELAVPVRAPDAEASERERAPGVLLATDAWLKALAFDGESWVVVETYDLRDRERIEAMRAGEDAVEAVLREREV